MGGIVFERAKSRDGTAKRTSGYVEAAVKRGSIKKGVMRKLKKNSQEKACARDSILIKLDVIDLHFFKTESPAHVFSCEFCEICKNKFFCITLLNDYF